MDGVVDELGVAKSSPGTFSRFDIWPRQDIRPSFGPDLEIM
jgi:hypothetical protein